ncbi:nucleotidyltransferase domain-containing protein, partial [Candidatus Gottesmanbacteria bacterium]|nr:nucleotidyltransferase domain-containing protein [Candidatus Gottesmanbacteria bacterium]
MDTRTLLNDTPERLIERYRTVLEASGIPVEQVILFGSYAKKKNKPWSDLDLCVVSKSFGKNILRERMMLASLT